MTLDAASYPLLWELALSTGVAPEWFVAVMASESGLNPARPNAAGAPYYGINQISGKYLRDHGVSPDIYLTWPASMQLSSIVIPYYKSQIKWWGKPLRSAGVLHSLALCQPDLSKSDDPDRVLAPVDGTDCGNGTYTSNAGLDVNNDGEITIQDLDDNLDANVFSPAGRVHAIYQAAYDKLYAQVPPGWVAPAHITARHKTKTGVVVVGILSGVAILASSWWLLRDRRTRQRFGRLMGG